MMANVSHKTFPMVDAGGSIDTQCCLTEDVGKMNSIRNGATSSDSPVPKSMFVNGGGSSESYTKILFAPWFC